MAFKLHIPEAFAGVDLAPWFRPQQAGVFNEEFPPNFFETSVERVPLENAQAIVIPNNFHKEPSMEAKQYIGSWASEGHKRGIPVFVFSLGDFTDHLQFDPRVVVLTLSVYRSTAAKNAVVMPTLTEDNAKAGIAVRPKQALPTVSFCGQAGYRTHVQKIKYYIKILVGLGGSVGRPSARAHIIGVYWRRKILAACKNSPLLRTLFIIRSSFSGARSTIELDPAQARKEFIQSIADADFVLAPKGDGNYSNRFLEALSMGRIPVVVDTDIVLPFEDKIDYSKMMVRVPMRGITKAPRLVREFYDALSEEEWQSRQRLARETFEKYLRQDSFFKVYFAGVLGA